MRAALTFVLHAETWETQQTISETEMQQMCPLSSLSRQPQMLMT